MIATIRGNETVQRGIMIMRRSEEVQSDILKT